MRISDLVPRIGQPVGTSDWFLLDQGRIDRFADATDDRQFIHTNPEMARATPFGGTIAHGFLTLSMLSAMMEDALEKPELRMAVNYGFNKVRFLTPVKSGKRVRGHFKLLDLEQKKPGQWQQIVEATVEIEGETKSALMAEWIFMLFE
jgi:acyl dehydratase